MRTRFPGFATVRAVCYGCGWYRILGYTGTNGDVRALIRVEPSRSSCNVLWSKVITVPADQEIADLAREYPQYHDLLWEWDWRRGKSEPLEARRPYRDMVKDRACPRCKRVGGVYLEVYAEYPKGGSYHWSCWVTA